MMKFDITDEEKETLKTYKDIYSKAIERLLVSNPENDIALFKDAIKKGTTSEISYKKEDIEKYLKTIITVYEIMKKLEVEPNYSREFKFSKLVDLNEVEVLKNEPGVDKMINAYTNVDKAYENKENVKDVPALLNIIGSDVPYLVISDVLSMTDDKDEVIIAPYTEIKEVKDISVLDDIGEGDRVYNLTLVRQELEELSEPERKGLYSFIIQDTDSIEGLIRQCIRLDEEKEEKSVRISTLEQSLLKIEDESERKEMEKDYPETERREDIEDQQIINKELSSVKDYLDTIFEKRKNLVNLIQAWKRNIDLYLKSECKEIDYRYKAESNVESEIKNSNNNSVEENTSKPEFDAEKLKKIEDDIKKDKEEIEKQSIVEIESKTIELIKDNEEKIKKLFANIDELINKEQNHAKVAGNIGSVYSALNNGFEMRRATETLQNQIGNIKLKLEEVRGFKDEKARKQKLVDICTVAHQVGILLNYLNNPKCAVPGTNITRFDEMTILEENELKRGIAEKIRDTLGEAELRKLKDDLEYIEEKSPVSKFFGFFTGQNKLDDFMIEQIEIRRECINRKLSSKMSLSYNYSIHDMVAKIRMFVRENYDDDLILDTVNEVKDLEDELKRNFVINDTRVETIIFAKEGKDLPVDSNKKLSKFEQYEIDTYQFLNKYEYDLKDDESKNEKYEDTMANEICTIIEYINSSNVLK